MPKEDLKGEDQNPKGGDQQPINDPAKKTEEEETISKESYEIIAQKYREMKARMDEMANSQKTAEEEKLKSQKKFEELFNKKEAELKELQGKYNTERKLHALSQEAAKVKARDVNVLSKLVNFDEIGVNEDGSVDTNAIQGILKGLQKTSPYLFDEAGGGQPANPTIGNGQGGSPEGGNNPSTMKRSELPMDSAVWNEMKITERLQSGELQIIDDITPTTN